MDTITLIQEYGEICLALVKFYHANDALFSFESFECRYYAPSALCVASTELAESGKRSDFPILR